MTVSKHTAYGVLSLLLIALYPQQALADGYTNKDYLAFTTEQKKYWLISTVDTLGFVASYKDKEQGRCVFEWYYKDDNKAQKHGTIEAYMQKYPTKSPSAILIALTEKACGAYVRTNK